MTPTPPRPTADRWIVLASRFHETVVDRLVEGAMDTLSRGGVAPDDVDVVRVPGAFEVPQAAAALLGRPGASVRGLVALAVVIRGETPHFDYICAEVARGLLDAGMRSGVPVGFGVLTCDTTAQALARAGGDHGNKGAEAAAAALELAEVLDRHRPGS